MSEQKQSRKIFNFESKILIEETINKFGYNPESLGNASAKFVIAACRFCGKKMDVRKGFFNKSGSACHKACKIEEMKLAGSPFANKEVREKASKIIKEKYGENRELIGEKISKSKKVSTKYKDTCMKKYGVENLFQLESVKEQIKKTNLERYGVESPMQNSSIREKTKQTCLDRYGVENPTQSPLILEKIKQTNLQKYGVENLSFIKDFCTKRSKTYSESIKSNPNYNLVNTLRSEQFWLLLKEKQLKDVCCSFNLNYQSATSAILKKEFSERYYSTYTFPKTQKQKEIFDFIKTIISDEVLMNDRKAISPLELDIYIPSKKLAIEFNGNFWHSEAILDHDVAMKKHHNKMMECRKSGIYLFQIFEHQWDNRKDQILNFIKTLLGANKTNINARECLITHDNVNDFINENHIQGNTHAVIKYFNLVYNNEIVASMTASNHHRQNGKKDAIVLSRLCFKDGINVRGGASKLFKRFVKWAEENGYTSVISWSDNCWTEGKIYPILGFNLEREYKQDYFYYNVKDHTVHSKQSQRKIKVNCPPEVREVDWCAQNNLYRIWNCGKRLWTYKIGDKQC